MRALCFTPLVVIAFIGASVRSDVSGQQAPAQIQSATAPLQSVEEASRRARERVRALQREAAVLAAQERSLLVELRQLEVDLRLRAEELAQINAEVTATTGELDRTESATRELQAEVARQKPIIAVRLTELYKLGRVGYWRLLLNVDDVNTVGRAYRSVGVLVRLDQDRMTAHRRTLASLTASRAALQTRQATLQSLRSEAQKVKSALDRAVVAHNERIRALDARRDLNARLVGELEMAQERLKATVGTLPPGEAPWPGLPLAPFRGDLDWPVEGRVTEFFGRQAHSRFGTLIRRNGVEIAAVEDSPVRAIHDGRVAYAAPFTGYGNLVIVDHGNQAYSLYGYLATLQVQPDSSVGQGTTLGTVGRPTGSEAPRLYFELRIDGSPVDPVEWLRKR